MQTQWGVQSPLTCRTEHSLIWKGRNLKHKHILHCQTFEGLQLRQEGVGLLSAAGSPELRWNAWSGNGNRERVETFLYGTIGYQRPQLTTPCSSQTWPGAAAGYRTAAAEVRPLCGGAESCRGPAWSFTTWVNCSSFVSQHESCGSWRHLVANMSSQIFSLML